MTPLNQLGIVAVILATFFIWIFTCLVLAEKYYNLAPVGFVFGIVSYLLVFGLILMFV